MMCDDVWYKATRSDLLVVRHSRLEELTFKLTC